MANGEVECTIGALEEYGSRAFLEEHGDDIVANSVWCSVENCSAAALFGQNGRMVSNGKCPRTGILHLDHGVPEVPYARSSPGTISIKDTRVRVEAAHLINLREEYAGSEATSSGTGITELVARALLRFRKNKGEV